MGLILNKKIQALMKGYPTISDKYDVIGGVIKTGNADVAFGAPLFFDTTEGTYKTVASGAAVSSEKFAGIALGTNVKLVTTYPAASTQAVYKAGEAVNCMIRGAIAVEVSSTVYAALAIGAKVYIGAGGVFTNDSTSALDINAKVLSKEQHGESTTTTENEYLVEIVF